MPYSPSQVSLTLAVTKMIIQDSENWCQHEIAMDSNGVSTSSESEDACKFCLVGAVLRATPSHSDRKHAMSALELALRSRPAPETVNLLVFNDKSAHQDVLSLIDEALDQLDQEIYDRDE